MEQDTVLTAFRKAEKRRYYSTSLELILDFLAYVLFFLGLASSGLFLLLSFGDKRAFLFSIVPCTLGVIASVVQWAILRCLAEVLRLLKKQSGISYSGSISGESFQEVFSCSNCGCMLHSDTRCDVCGARITEDNQSDAESVN